MPVTIRDDYPHLSAGGGQCYSCGAGRRDIREGYELRKERVVDLGVSIDMEGFLLICETCTVEAGRLLGLVSPDERDEAVARADELERALVVATAERDEAKALFRMLRQYDAAAVSVPTDNPVDERDVSADEAPTTEAPARETRTRAARKPAKAAE